MTLDRASLIQSALQAIEQVVGAAHVLRQSTQQVLDLTPWEQDWRQRVRGRALAVVLPANVQQVADVMRICAQTQIAVVPQGGNTGLVQGGVPDESGTQLVLSMRRMNSIRQVDTQGMTLTAEAGCVLQHVQQAADAVGACFPLSLASQGSCTIGGNLATNAGGTQVLRYGTMRDLCLGLEVVTAQGNIWHGLNRLRKDNTGYDLRHLLIGSEGTLGIITAATLKLFAKPTAKHVAWVSVPSLQSAVALLRHLEQHVGSALTAFEVVNQLALSLVHQHLPHVPMPGLWQHHPYGVLIEQSVHGNAAPALAQFEEGLSQALQQSMVADVVLAQSLQQAAQLWQVRESISAAQARLGLNIKHDISLPIDAMAAFVAQTDALLLQHWPGIRLVTFGHLGDGNLHYNVQAPVGQDAAEFLRQHEVAINHCVWQQVVQHQGSISAEHGIGTLRRDVLSSHKDPVALAMMRQVKSSLDPENLLNPGKVLQMAPNAKGRAI